MRVVSMLVGVSALAFAHAAAAAPVSLAPISFSPEFQTDLEEEYGVREGEILQTAVREAVAAELQSRGATVDGAGGLTIEISIVDADPNRPTMQQLADQPGLDSIRSISIGGAELRAVLRGANGAVVSEVTHRRYNHSLADIAGPAATWTEARRAIRQFARKVADAYEANAQ
ncbi:MAG TPA: hypothetical protein VEA80_11225 [Vitreimonas sp.]|uniref:hypothetical protein n=1 Tax=Vitreimonas sp. TaxID=3069702 RepID=UPI002D451DFD|nr:hypothetical protein [Vitreimonas sp.]HYD88038.1 hypothetical protein [Vitreimonas sp.]